MKQKDGIIISLSQALRVKRIEGMERGKREEKELKGDDYMKNRDGMKIEEETEQERDI